MRSHPLWLAFLAHRLSGLALALFLPVHFYVLALALTAPDQLDRFLSLAENPLVKLSEVILVFLLALHAFGGLRLMAFELFDWAPPQKTWAAAATALALLVATLFLLRAL